MEKKKPPNRKLADRMKRLDSLDKSDAFMKNNSFAVIIDNFSIQNTWYPSKNAFWTDSLINHIRYHHIKFISTEFNLYIFTNTSQHP